MHTTASVFINDDEPGLHHDYEMWLEKLAPHAPTNAYRHNRTGEDNADAHLKRQIMGREVVVAITKGKLDNRDDDFPAHDLALKMSVGVVFARPVVSIGVRRSVRSKFFQPHFIVVMKARFIVVDEYRSGGMH